MRATLIATLACVCVAAAEQTPSRTPAPQGVDITARDGDRILVDDDARIHIVRRRQATIRTIFSGKERLLIVLVDYSKPGEFPDGMVDWAYNFYEVEGTWPLGPRWEGLTAIFQYEGNQARPRGLAFETPQGLVQVLPRPLESASTDPRARAVLSHGATFSGPRRSISFAEAETMQLSDAARTKASGATVSTAMLPAGAGRGIGSATVSLGTAAIGETQGSKTTQTMSADGTENYSYILPAVADRTPTPPGLEISANDGDRVIVDDGARIQVVRRRQALIRAVFSEEHRMLVLLADYAGPGGSPDGKVDAAFNFYEVEGNSPIAPRWEALTTLYRYEGDPMLPTGYALATPQGLVHLSPGQPGMRMRYPTATAVLWFRGSSTRYDRNVSFAEAEKLQLSEAANRR